MLTALELENFKGIAGRQRLEFAPLTLLFGANSAGKSSILQALIYLNELLMHGDPDVDRTDMGGETLELGGFSRLVHRHDSARTMVIRAEFATPGQLNGTSRDLAGFPFRDLDDEVASAWLDVWILHRTTSQHRGPVVTRARVGVGTHPEPLIWLDVGPTCHPSDPLYARINLGHPVLGEAALEVSGLWEELAVSDTALSALRDREQKHDDEMELDEWFGGDILDGDHSLPVFALSRSRLCAMPALDEPIRILPPFDDELSTEQTAALEEVRTFLEMTVIGTTAQLARTLQQSLYIGPLRSVPARGLLLERPGRTSRWSNGLAAWDMLLSDRTTLVEKTNHWLERFEAGCRVVVQELVDVQASAEDLSERHVDSTVRRLVLSTDSSTLVLPSEVGAGISQMVPVIVAAVADIPGGFTLVEQPEIHVHPALQVALGDLFLKAAHVPGRQFLIETHSEHLLLRLMRRMRETSEQTSSEHDIQARRSDVRVWLIERHDDGCLIRDMPLNEHGDLVKAWPGGFFEEGLREVL